jgi:hypothetical protein
MNKKIVATFLFFVSNMTWAAEAPLVSLSIVFNDLLSDNPEERLIRVTDSRDRDEAKKIAAGTSESTIVVTFSRLFKPSTVIFEIIKMKKGTKTGKSLSLEALIAYQKGGSAALQDPERMVPVVKTFLDCFFKGDFTNPDNFNATACCIEGDTLYCVYDPYYNPSEAEYQERVTSTSPLSSAKY